MKKINLILFSAFLLINLISCVDEADDYNNDKDRVYNVEAAALITNAQKELSDQMTTPSVNLNVFRYFSQYWAATTYTTESRYRVSTRKIPDNHWNNLFRDVLGNLNSAKSAVYAEVKPVSMSDAEWTIQQKNKISIIEIQMVYTFQILVDTFGDIPYSEALNPAIVLPKYENDELIYPKLITRLNEALNNLDTNGTSFEKGDYIFNGDTEKWKLFGNSLKVKLGINIADFNNTLAKSTIESAYSAGVILSNSDNALFEYVSLAPNYNPIYDNLVASGRNDFVPAKTIVDEMNNLLDPRREKYFTFKPNTTTYVGGRYGYTNTYTNFSHISDGIKQDKAPGILFEADEVCFYLAEAAERGYIVGNTAEYYYNKGIENSFELWNATDVSVYLANPTVAYSTAAGTWKEKIGKQAWIALFNRGFESWNSWRRLDFPTLVAPANAYSEANGLVPRRLTYPSNEQTVNGDNYNAASLAIGGDKLYTKVFWDVN